MNKLLLVAAALLFSASASANIVINGTRVIYGEKSKEAVVQLVNNGDDPSLVQAWIDDGDINSTPETAKVPFLLSPPVVKVSGHSGQQLRIQKVGAALPTDRESVFYLNVLDIPPTPENLSGKNVLQLAIKSRIKLFYRPANLAININDAPEHLSLKAGQQNLTITNSSPYYVTISTVTRAKDTNKALTDSAMVPPLSSAILVTKENLAAKEALAVHYVDDLGAYRAKVITTQ